MYDFANVLFAGPCNRACPFCIGKQLPDRVNVANLDVFPPRGLDAFVHMVNTHRIPEIVFTGTTSDPQLYRYEGELLAWLRECLHPAARFSVHTNGVRALKKLAVFNSYDRACLSVPSFVPETYRRMMGEGGVPDVGAILGAAEIPVKVSCVLSEHNVHEVDAFVAECARLGVRRLVFRRLFGETRRWSILAGLEVVRTHRNNPVYELDGMEITYWDFGDATSRSINLFADGTLGTEYLLTETRMTELVPAVRLGRPAGGAGKARRSTT